MVRWKQEIQELLGRHTHNNTTEIYIHVSAKSLGKIRSPLDNLTLEGDDIMSYKVSIVIEKDEFGYYAYCPELEGCQSQGDTFEEVMVNIKEAIELYLETLSQDEIKESVSKEILTTTLEVQVA
jgi:predicted RNase H-like HicB family nuclease